MADERDWVFERAVARVAGPVDALVAEFATAYVGRPVRRREVFPPRPSPGITWSIDGDVVVEFVHHDAGADQILVHDVSLLEPLKRRFRTRRVHVSHAAPLS